MTSSKQRVVLVTGASKGMGAGISRAFAKEEACLSLIAIDDDAFDAVVGECKDLGAPHILKIVTDLTKKENMEMVVTRTIEELGRIDVLVNNAGIVCNGTIEEIKLEDLDKTLKINTITPLYLTQLVIPYLEKTKGNVVNISSIYSTMCVATNMLGYNLSKAALDQLTRISALDLAKKDIRVNAVNPSICETPIIHDVADIENIDVETLRQRFRPLHPLGKEIMDVKNVADAVLFLSSDAACKITGVTLPIDCGRRLAGK